MNVIFHHLLSGICRGLPHFLLWSVFDHEVDENGPEIRTFRIARQDFVKHVAAFLGVAEAELQLSELGDYIHT